MAIIDKLRNWYGDWSARYGEGFFLYGAFSSALTSLWIVQNILRESFGKLVPLPVIAIVFISIFSLGCYVIDKFGLIEARANAVAKRNKYMRKIDNSKNL